jgi:SAM-dependent methyltransferase/ribosomal protein S27AE
VSGQVADRVGSMPDAGTAMECPLCGCGGTLGFHVNRLRSYRRCGRCLLTFVPAAEQVTAGEAEAIYRLHRNDPSDTGYRAFLDRLARHLPSRVSPGGSGLDFGCGPGPTLSVMLEERGYRMRVYDPVFAPDDGVLSGDYDFVTCTETAEHFVHPGREFRRLDGLLRPGGWLAVMTQMLLSDEAFPGWGYQRDPTHVAFYRLETMHWIAGWMGWRLELPVPHVALFQKGGSGATG